MELVIKLMILVTQLEEDMLELMKSVFLLVLRLMIKLQLIKLLL